VAGAAADARKIVNPWGLGARPSHCALWLWKFSLFGTQSDFARQPFGLDVVHRLTRVAWG
jgi:hypothetical protein